MDGFHEVLFPLAIGFSATGGPERSTEIVSLGSGHERRNQRWADSRRRYDVGTGVRSHADLHTVIAFFEERRGRLYGFRFRDPADQASAPPGTMPAPTDQALGSGDGATAAFRLVKTYGGAFAPWTRRIDKPVAGSVRVAVAGVETDAFTLDATTGTVTFAPDAVPPEGAAVTAGFRFDVPVRFDTDRLAIDFSSFAAGAIPSIPLVEVRV
ncbi:DUF2460 domain-containing protein [Prosthecomicrobium pneumaticum]|uniref:Uncharacterized protein (TIGR02217 family) n=1 Tax=Prosthecomicrobium pneumaticum TaxID=81895 RepID=A0A7W9FR87_9HYPH|nr:DUF2460 domain-containing protein [Prosthecomicrobium pneumaticum]MBB5755291.1 uncharacterized protein (TIGR02217 family) [Prosthecomicrobium pneumaticum]